jgi:Flp pilus assembly protein TadG
MFGIIDAARLLYTINQMQKAVDIGARHAVVTNIMAQGLADYDFAASGGLAQGASIPQSAFSGVQCSVSGCTCKSGTGCVDPGEFKSTDFANLIQRMTAIYPPMLDTQLQVEYDWSGIGFAGDPNAPDIAPIVTVSLRDLRFQPVTTLLFSTDVPLPAVRASLTLEDGVGMRAN